MATAVEEGDHGATSEVLSVLQCSVCLGMYKSPTILPQCGHSFCLTCIAQLVEQSERNADGFVKLNCPECRTASKFRADLSGLHRNFQLDKAIRFYVEANPGQKIPAVYPSAPCVHLESVLEPTLCKHCKQKLCHVCLFRHIERVRLELTWAATGLEGRFEKAGTAKLYENVADVKSKIEDQVEKIQAGIKAENKAFLEAVAKAVADYEQRACEQVRKVGADEIASVDGIVEAAKKGVETKAELDAKITKMNNSSLLFYPADKVVDIFHEVLDIDKKISAIEKVASGKFEPAIALKEDSCYKEILDKLAQREPSFVVNKLEDLSPAGKKKFVTEVQLVHEAAQQGDLATLREILLRPNLPRPCRKFASEHHGECASDFYKQSPLIEAASNGHLDAVRFLVLDLDVHAANHPDNKEFYSMAIQLAAEKGHIDVVKFLVEAAKNRENAGQLGASLQTFPVNNGTATGEELKMEVEVEEKPAIDAPNEVAKRKRRLASLPNVAEPGKGPESPKEEVEPAKKMCINFGPAIRSAISVNQIDTARYLLAQSGEKFESILTGDHAEKLLFAASADGHLEAVKFLVEDLKVSPNESSQTLLGQTPLHGAASKGHLQIVRYLVEKGADIMAISRLQSYHKGMPIHAAAQNGHAETVGYFIELKPELVKAKAGDEKSVLQIASLHNQEAVVDLIKAKMASLGVVEEPAPEPAQPPAAQEQQNAGQVVEEALIEPAESSEDEAEEEEEDEEEDMDDDDE